MALYFPLDAPTDVPVPRDQLVNVVALLNAYYEQRPNPADPAQRVRFGTSGHRGSSLDGTYTEAHVLAITQAICDYRTTQGIAGPLFLGKDTHALSSVAFTTVLEVLAANGVETMIDESRGCTPTPAISYAILTHGRTGCGQADGIVITPSHNPPEDGGLKYNPPSGGPADAAITRWIENRANDLLLHPFAEVSRVPFQRARQARTVHTYDYVGAYVDHLTAVVNMDAIAAADLRIGVDPLGGATLAFWHRIAEQYRLRLEVVNKEIDPRFGFMPRDWDGRIRMDCSSPHAMARLIGLKDRFDLAFGNDPDGDRHGIVTAAGLMNPNHYLAAAVFYLFTHRDSWSPDAAVGKTIVSSSFIDRVARKLRRRLIEVPVGFKWFVPGLHDGSLAFGGEESAGASCLRRNGTPWSTDKDGIVLSLLAVELMAHCGCTPAELYAHLADDLGASVYERVDAPATLDEKAILETLTLETVRATELAGEPIEHMLTVAPGNGAPIGGLKVVTRNGWFAARPSGTEAVYKLYAESFRGREHLEQIQQEARAIVATALAERHR
jgi:phosphoglucomutase